MTDIIDRIDELVDDQLADRWRRDDYDIGQDHCPRCGRHWHGLPITAHIDQMYRSGWYDPAYISADDDSPIVCEGAEFIGPIRPPMRTSRREVLIRIVVDNEAFAESMRRFHAEMERLTAAWHSAWQGIVQRLGYIGDGGTWTLDWLNPAADYCRTAAGLPEIDWTPGPHNWGCELRIQTEPQWPNPVLSREMWDRCSPLGTLIRSHWDAFTAPEVPPLERRAIDFSKYSTGEPEYVDMVRTQRGRR